MAKKKSFLSKIRGDTSGSLNEEELRKELLDLKISLSSGQLKETHKQTHKRTNKQKRALVHCLFRVIDFPKLKTLNVPFFTTPFLLSADYCFKPDDLRSNPAGPQICASAFK